VAEAADPVVIETRVSAVAVIGAAGSGPAAIAAATDPETGIASSAALAVLGGWAIGAAKARKT
jgi:hypothetical protein